jgi:hypothetical protein
LEGRINVEPLDYWRLSDEVSVVQAALLIVGEDPSDSQEHVDGWEAQNRPKGYDATLFVIMDEALSKIRIHQSLRP